MHYNIGKALDALKFTHDDWPWLTKPTPQVDQYLEWLKQHLVSGHPVVWMIMDKGDPAHLLGLYDHIEPVWGIYSNHSLDDTVVYPTDVVVHGSDYGASGSVEG